MSLINDALKKAQRQRAEEVVTLPPMSRSRRSDGSRNGTQTMILIGAGAAVLIAVSVVVTVHFLSDRTATPHGKTSPAPVAAPIIEPSPPRALLVPSPIAAAPRPIPFVALPRQSAKGTPAPVESQPSPESAPSSAPVATSNDNTGPIILTDSLKTDEEIQGLVDKFKVSGVRSGGSKVLMNDHIVRLNEVVDRATGLRLVKIEDDMLIFKDAKGTLYTKNF